MELLIVDDEDKILELLAHALSSKNITVTTADSARAAMGLLEKRRFDIVLTDIEMETSSAGIDLARKVRKKFPQTDVLIMTDPTTEDVPINALKLGVYDFVVKPIDLFMAKLALRRCLERRNLHARIELCVRAVSSSAEALSRISTRMAGRSGEDSETAEIKAAVNKVQLGLEKLRALGSPLKLEI